jgi:hypothetical protein
MGAAKRKRDEQARAWPGREAFRGTIKLHALPPVDAINGARIRELTGDDRFPADTPIILRTFRAEVGDRSYHVGFCLGDGEAFSAIGIAVIERLSMEVPKGPLHIVPVQHADIAWDMVLRHLRTFDGQTLLFCFPDSDVYDAGVAEISYSKHIEQFDPDGEPLGRLTDAQRRIIRERKAEILDRPPPPKFYPAGGIDQEDAEWIFRIATPAGKVIRTAVWNGRRNYEHELPKDIVAWVGGDRIALVQVSSPVGVDRRSSLVLTHHLAKEFDGMVHWAKDTETFQSILRSFIRLDLESVGRPNLPANWDPEIVILAAND